MPKDCFLETNIDDTHNNLLRLFSFFDIFNYPLTFWEIKGYLFSLTSLNNLYLIDALKDLKEKKIVEEKNGFYFLKNREELINIRLNRYNFSQKKIKKAKKFIKIFSLFPCIKMIALVNSIGSFNLKEGGDIDFFIIAKQDRVWLTRLYCTGIAKILNSRPKKGNKKDKICLSFYLGDKELNLNSLKLKNGDPYFDIWQKDMLVLFERHNIKELFLKENSISENKLSNNLKSELSLLKIFDKLSQKLQLIIMPKNLKQAAELKEGVVIDRNILKFYLEDKRLFIKEKYEEKFRKITTTYN